MLITKRHSLTSLGSEIRIKTEDVEDREEERIKSFLVVDGDEKNLGDYK